MHFTNENDAGHVHLTRFWNLRVQSRT